MKMIDMFRIDGIISAMLRYRAIRALTLLASVFLIITSLAAAFEYDLPTVARARFSPLSTFEPGVEIGVRRDGWIPSFVFLNTVSGQEVAATFEIDDEFIRFKNGGFPSSSMVIVYDRVDIGIVELSPEVTVHNINIAGSWEDHSETILAEITGITDSLTAGMVGAVDTHKVGFNTTTAPLSDSAIIWIALPPGFSIGAIDDTAYFDNDPANDLNQPRITAVTVEGQVVKFQLNQGALPALPGSRISIRFGSVDNSVIAGQYSVGVAASDADGNIDNGPGISDPFTLVPDVLDQVVVEPDTAMTAPSDTIINFTAAGFDQYGNEISGLDFAWIVTVDSCGDVFGGAFRALKVGDCFVAASSGGFADLSGPITVVPGELGRFSLSGCPAQTNAGIPFIIPVNVTAYDINDNIKSDYAGSVWFTSTDPDATLPFTPGSPYNFNTGDSGSHNFPGSGFILRSAGLRTIAVTDGVLSTSSNYINVLPGVIISFNLTAGSPQTAGVTFVLQASDALDSLGNLASGEIIVADSIGGGDSPDGIPPSLNRIIVVNGFGSSFQTLTNAEPTVLKGTVSGTFAVAATDTIIVFPGNLGRFEMAGYPDSSVAGVVFPEPGIAVTAVDLFGNLKTNYADSVYFTSTDPLAALPYTESSKYKFVVADSGSHTFPGSGFTLYTAGNHHLTVTDDSVSDQSGAIHVSAGAIAAFMIFATDSITAGIPFAVTAIDCRDAWNNLANGTINVIDSVGGGYSPNGSSPIFNAIRVSGGSGASNQTLVNTVTTVLKGYVGSIIRITDSIYVMPGDVGAFTLDISTPQFSGIPFSGPADVTALDYYGNVKFDFNASADTVVITSSAGGSMFNNVLRQAGDFTDGVADLTASNITYIGRGGNMTFSAESESGAGGVSGAVNMRAVSCSGLVIDQGVVSWGDTATGAISVTNEGGVPVEITDFEVFSESGLTLNPDGSAPPLPDSLGPGINRIYDITIPIHSGMAQGQHPLTASVSGLFGANAVHDTLNGFPDTVIIQTASEIGYIDGSIDRDTLSTGAVYSLSIRLGNAGGAGLGLIDTSYIRFTDGVRTYAARLTGGFYIPPDNPSGITVFFDSTMVPSDFAPGDYPVRFYYFGQENGHLVVDSLDLTDPVTVQNSASVEYISGSINIDTLAAGQPAAFVIRISNSGTASFEVDHANTFLRFADAQRQYAAYADTSTGLRVDLIAPGDTTFYFEVSTLSPEFTPGRYLPAISLRGEQNGVSQTAVFDTFPDSIEIISRGSLRIDTTYVMCFNAPFVNTAQACSIRVVIFNEGDERIDSVYARLTSDGSSLFADSILLGDIEGHSYQTADYPAVSSDLPDSGEVLVSSLSGGHGRISGLPPLILTPLDNAAILIVETPALLSLSPLTAVWPPGAEDDTVTIGQNVTVSTSARNLGQAGIFGSQRLVLDTTGSGFIVADSLTRDFLLDGIVSWDIAAPLIPDDSAVLTARFFSYPSDANDGSDAVGPDSVVTIDFTVVTTPSIAQIPAIIQPPGALDGVISANQMFVVSNTLQAFGEYYGLSTTILLPFGYTTDDSITKFPSGNTASWDIRAPDNAFLDSIEFASSLLDINTGQTHSAGPEYIRVETVAASNLELVTRIAGPNAALDGIIEPGAYLNFEAVVNNNGQAAAGAGRLSLHIENPDLVTPDQIIRQFLVGQPLLWTIDAPSREVSTAVPIWVSLDSIPDDENSGLPSHLVNDSSGVLVSVRELLPRLEFWPLLTHSGSVVKGRQLPFFNFELRNNDRGGAFAIGITQIRIGAAWNPGQNPAPFASAALFSDTVVVSEGQIGATEILLEFADTLVIDPGQSAPFLLRIGILPDTPVNSFTLSIEGGDVQGVIFDEGSVAGQIAAGSPADAPLWNSPPVAILEQSFAGSVSSYPNPFNPAQTAARIGYYLTSDSDLRLRIFTLFGDLVWTKEISAADPLGRAGLHTGDTAVMWDGKNDSGYDVHSGVYICIVENVSGGQEEKLKIAIVK